MIAYSSRFFLRSACHAREGDGLSFTPSDGSAFQERIRDAILSCAIQVARQVLHQNSNYPENPRLDNWCGTLLEIELLAASFLKIEQAFDHNFEHAEPLQHREKD